MKKGYIVHNACTDTGMFSKLSSEGLIMKSINIDRKISLKSNLKSVIELYKLIKKEKYDIVHVHTPIAAILGRLAAKLAGAPCVIYTAHGFYFHDDMPKIKYKIFYTIEKVFGRHFTDWILLQSKEDYELCINDKFQQENRIIHISNGVDVINKMNPQLISESTISEYKKELGINSDDIVIGFIGRLVKEKGIIELLEATEKIVQKHKNVRLLLIGDVLESERDQETYLLIQKYLQYPYVKHLGFRKDIPELLSIMDIFTLPSYREGLPRSIIEAMALQKPVVATNIRGCREEVIDGVNGYLVDKKNSTSLFDELLKLVNNKDLRDKFGASGREMALKQFNEELVIKKQLDLFGKLAGVE